MGLVKGDIIFTPYAEVESLRKTIDKDLFQLLAMLAVLGMFADPAQAG